jgi:orotidine-5'-phosphate decarboxylase
MKIPPEKVIVALDTPSIQSATNLLDELKDHRVWVKVGMELFYGAGPEIILKAHNKGFKVFLDLKLHDIPNTVGQSLNTLTKLPFDMINIHAAGGQEMMKRAAEAIKSSYHPPLLIAVTQLTSTSTEQMNLEQKIPGDLTLSVLNYAKLALESGCDGVVSSPLEVKIIKSICGSDFITVTPGIRPKDSNFQDQKRVTTPLEALELGTDFMVIGRPITEAKDPRKALENILRGQK